MQLIFILRSNFNIITTKETFWLGLSNQKENVIWYLLISIVSLLYTHIKLSGIKVIVYVCTINTKIYSNHFLPYLFTRWIFSKNP